MNEPQTSARWLLTEILGDFAFFGAASRANALALMLLPFVREHVDGPTPLHVIDADAQGVGKTLLATLCLLPTLQDLPPTLAPRTEREWTRLVNMAVAQGLRAVHVEGRGTRIDSDILAAALTSTSWAIRGLGERELSTRPNTAAWCFVSNGDRLSPDLARRAVWTLLGERARPGYRSPHLLGFCRSHQAEIVSAVETIRDAWLDAGKPLAEPSMPSFDAWSRVMGGILAHCGVEGFAPYFAAEAYR